MESITLYNKQDLEKFKHIIGYFLESKEGLLKSKNDQIPSYASIYIDNLEVQILVSQVISSTTKKDNQKLIEYINNQREDALQRIKKYEEYIENCKKNIENYDFYQPQIEKCKTFKESFELIIKY